MNVNYVLQDETFSRLRSFLKRGGHIGDTEMMRIDSIPGVEQSPLNIIRLITDTGKVDEYGKAITEKQIIVDDEFNGRCDKMLSVFPYGPDKNIVLTGKAVQYTFDRVESADVYFRNRYYDDILMMLSKLEALDKEHSEEHDMMIEMIKEIQKER